MNNALQKIMFTALMAISCLAYAVGQTNRVVISTTVIPPVSPYFNQMLSGIGGRINVQVTNVSVDPVSVRIVGRISCISPNPFTISLSPAYMPLQPIVIPGRQSLQLTNNLLQQTFGNFNENNLLFSGISPAGIKSGVNYKMPEGMYQLCFIAYSTQNGQTLSDPNGSCTTFSICYKAGAPQFITPVNGISVTDGISIVNKNSPVAFTWTPPLVTCGMMPGGITYDFEIRPLIQGQTVTDAINNPYVFQKKGLPYSTFILDTNLYKNVLSQGKQYVIRVRANNNINGPIPVEIDNLGYSRVEAFQYGAADALATAAPPAASPAPQVPVNAPFVAQASCPAVPAISNTTPITAFNPNDQDLIINSFKLHIDQATQNNDGSFKGNGYIAWHPAATDLKLQVVFDAIRINTDKWVYDGSVRTATDPAYPQWSPFVTSNPVAGMTGLGDNTYTTIANRLSDGVHTLNSASGNAGITFPLGYNTTVGGNQTTIAVMGILFQPACTNMNVLLPVNLADAGGWLLLAGTGIQTAPDKLLAQAWGLLYLPQKLPLSFNGMSFSIKPCTAGNAGVDTAGGTYVKWNQAGSLDRVVVNTHIEFTKYSSVRSVNSQEVATTNPFGVQAAFTFADWNDWIAAVKVDSALQISELPGFLVSGLRGGSYDHSSRSNPDGMILPVGYAGAAGTSWQGLVLASPVVVLPKGFKSGITGMHVSFSFKQFLLDMTGVSADMTADNVLSIKDGSISGWPFSIDHIGISILQDNPQSGMNMKGGLQIPLSTDPLPYACNLNAGAGKEVVYAFNVQPTGTYNVGMWSATMTIDDNSSFTITENKDTFVIAANLDGSLSIGTETVNTSLPKISLKGLTFQNMKLTNVDKKTHLFNFAAGSWAFNGINLSNLTADMTSSGGAAGGNGSSQGTASGLKLNLIAFKPYLKIDAEPNDAMEVDMGITFGMGVKLDVSPLKIGGSATMDVFGIVHFPPGGSPQPDKSNPHILLDSIGIKFSYDKIIDIDGGVRLYREDATFGDGAKGIVNATFIQTVSVSAAVIFGKIVTGNSYNYWGAAAQAYWKTGIKFPPGLSLNGFGGGFHYNMVLGNVNAATATDPASLIGALTPHQGDLGFDAQVIMAYLDPQLFYFKPTLQMDFTTKGGLLDMKLQGPGELMAKNPPNGKGIVSVLASATYVPNPENFNASLIVQGSLNQGTPQSQPANNGTTTTDNTATKQQTNGSNPASNVSYGLSVNIPIEFNLGEGGDYFDVGKPAPAYTAFNSGALNSMVTVQLGFDAHILHANAVAYAYLDAGNTLPSAPYLPPALENSVTQGSSKTAEGVVTDFSKLISSLSNANTSNGSPTGTVNNPGFLFGAGIHLDAGLDLVVVTADGSLDIGFASMLEHFDATQVINSGCSPTGVIGFNNWYAMAMLYANLTMDLKLVGITIASLNAGAILTAGLPSPTWAKGDVYMDVTAVGHHFNGNYGFSLGKPCAIIKNPLDNLQLIERIGPTQPNGQGPEDVYTVPYVVSSMPLNQDYPIVLNNGELRTYRFMVDQFDVSSNKGTVLKGQQKRNGDNEMDLAHDDMLCGNATYKAQVRIRAYQVVNGVATDPLADNGTPAPLYQDTTFSFTTGPRPGTIELRNLIYSYPMQGQRYLLKNEFGGKGQVVVGTDVGYLMDNSQQNDCSNPALDNAAAKPAGTNAKGQPLSLTQALQGATMVMKFIPDGGGDTLQTPFTYNYNTGASRGTLAFQLPAGIKNSSKYQLQAWVTPPVPEPEASGPSPSAHTKYTSTNGNPNQVTGTTGDDPTVAGSVASRLAINTKLSVSNGVLNGQPDGPHCIFSTYFGTSSYNTFAGKMSAYGKWTADPEFLLTSEMPIYSSAAAAEPFDVWEVEGYSSACNTNGYQQPSFEPMFGAGVPDDAALQNDVDATALYAALLKLAPYATINMGAPEVRAPLWFMPDRALSLKNMPFQPALTAPGDIGSKATGVNLKSTIQPIVQPTGNNKSSTIESPKYLVHDNSSTAPAYGLPLSAKATGISLQSAGTAPALGRYDFSQSSSVSGSALTPQPKPGLDWMRDTYLKADYELLERFVNTVAANQNVLAAIQTNRAAGDADNLVAQSNIIEVTGSYGSISMNTSQITSVADWKSFFTQVIILSRLKFTAFPPTAARPVNFSYAYSLCGNCGMLTATVPATFSYQADQIPRSAGFQDNKKLPTLKKN